MSRSVAVVLLCVLGACAEAEPASIPLDRRVEDTIRRARETLEARAPVTAAPEVSQPARRPVRARLSPLADSIARLLVFDPASQEWFMAAPRGKRMMIDVGRADVTADTTPVWRAAFAEAVRARAPLAVGSRVRVSGAWGADDAVVDEITVWGDRLVALVRESPRVERLARRTEPLPAAVQRVDSAAPPTDRTCDRTLPDSAFLARANWVRDSVATAIMDADYPPYLRLVESIRVAGSRVPGCFGIGRLMLIVSVRAGGYDWVRERFVVMDDSGRVHQLTTPVYRQRAHDGVAALDTNGDGIDELAVRVIAPRAGALSILKIDERRRLLPMASGFAWEVKSQ